MDRFPPEIWEQIFIFVCTDSGRTGLSLSLVSRYFHNVSRSHQYQSVSFTRSKHIPLFRNTLSHAPLDARRIKYLYVCCPNVFLYVSDGEDSDYVETPMALSGSSGSNESMQIGSDSSGEKTTKDRQLSKSFKKLLTIQPRSRAQKIPIFYHRDLTTTIQICMFGTTLTRMCRPPMCLFWKRSEISYARLHHPCLSFR